MRISVSAVKKAALICAILVILSVATFLGYKYFHNRNSFNPFSQISLKDYKCEIPSNYNVFFDRNNKIVAGIKDNSDKEIWEMTEIAPVVLGYETINDVDYLVGAVKDSSGECKRVLLAYKLNLESFKNLDDPNLYDTVMINDELVDPASVKETFQVGKQVVAMYLSKSPTKQELTDEFCKSYGAASEQFCTYDVAQSQFGFEPKDLDGATIKDDSLVLFIPYWYSFEYASTIIE